MRLAVERPRDYDHMRDFIHALEWKRADLIYHVIACLDLLLDDLEPETADDLLLLIGGRYGLVPKGKKKAHG